MQVSRGNETSMIHNQIVLKPINLLEDRGSVGYWPGLPNGRMLPVISCHQAAYGQEIKLLGPMQGIAG